MFPGKSLHTDSDIKLHLDPVRQSRHCGGTGIPLSSMHSICSSLEIDNRHISVQLSQLLTLSSDFYFNSYSCLTGRSTRMPHKLIKCSPGSKYTPNLKTTCKMCFSNHDYLLLIKSGTKALSTSMHYYLDYLQFKREFNSENILYSDWAEVVRILRSKLESTTR